MNSYYCVDEFDDFEKEYFDDQGRKVDMFGNIIHTHYISLAPRIIRGYVVVHKLVKGKCCWCDEPPKEADYETWSKNAAFILESKNARPSENLKHIYCYDYAVLSTMVE